MSPSALFTFLFVLLWFGDGRFHPNRQGYLAYWGRDKMAAISQTSFSNWFSWIKTYEFKFLKIIEFYSWCQISNIPALVQIMAWRRADNKPLSEPMMVSLLSQICVTRPWWVDWNWGIAMVQVSVKQSWIIWVNKLDGPVDYHWHNKL